MLAGLNEPQWEEMGEFFHAEQTPDEVMDLFELHGFMTALAILPEPSSQDAWLGAVMGDSGVEPPERIRELMQTMLQGIANELDSGDGVEMPMELLPDDEEEGEFLRSWCLGFIEGQMLNEEPWFQQDPDRVAGLCLPIAAFSGAVDEEDLGGLLADASQRERLAQQIPDSLDELFLHFREEHTKR
ncbi:MAG: YecA family protein [Gammaproteobacteria bacterium]|nr:YecA family protein [Gammaproteobacteria bacterium]